MTLHDRIRQLGVIPVLELPDPAIGVELAHTLAEAGLPAIEVSRQSVRTLRKRARLPACDRLIAIPPVCGRIAALIQRQLCEADQGLESQFASLGGLRPFSPLTASCMKQLVPQIEMAKKQLFGLRPVLLVALEQTRSALSDARVPTVNGTCRSHQRLDRDDSKDLRIRSLRRLTRSRQPVQGTHQSPPPVRWIRDSHQIRHRIPSDSFRRPRGRPVARKDQDARVDGRILAGRPIGGPQHAGRKRCTSAIDDLHRMLGG